MHDWLMDRPPVWHLLETLPAELRIQIYEYIFAEPSHTSLLICSDSKIEIISSAKAHAAMLKTCRLIHHEAAPILYDTVTFRVQIYPVEGYSRYGNLSGFNGSSPFLRHIRHLHVKVYVLTPGEVKAANRLTQELASALEEANADVKTLQASSNFGLSRDRSTRVGAGRGWDVDAVETVQEEPPGLLDRIIERTRMGSCEAT
ncbi:hypothetical protein LTR09_003291 [Extremus antarcticus]|uniref:Uncharacterized protein n=1 Tax=Extremus antarcticus TaxID=702011 RepID=A0AAJ0LUQ5_9PEZI|nr:hypothetical protein LTR09_003291 [Extremus antarcticus]